jgi:hypothetical protein
VTEGKPVFPLEGGCLCGAVRYRIDGPVASVDYCHCRMCQKGTGTPAVAWATGPFAGFHWTKGAPRGFRSSAIGRRWFCAGCGSPLAFEGFEPEGKTMGISLATLDDPTALRPRQHAWIGTRIPWHAIDETLPQYEDEGPDSGI